MLVVFDMLSVSSSSASQTGNTSLIHIRMYSHSSMTLPPFLCTAWNEAVSDFPPADKEMPVSMTALQSERGKRE